MSDLISRQAAIDVCNNAIDLWHGQLGEGIVIAVRKKIAELPSAQPNLQPTCNQLATDCISRQAAIKAIEDLQDCYNGFSDTYDKACIIGVLEELPSAPERRGKWIYYPKASGSVTSTAVHLYPVCSECGCEHPIANYCPNCGARMEVDDNG